MRHGVWLDDPLCHDLRVFLLLGTSATLVVTGALLVVTKSY